jgi:hypothetical protein
MILLFRPLDFVLFDDLTTIRKTAHGEFGDDSVLDQSTKVLSAHGQVGTSFTIQDVFRKAWLTPHVMSRTVWIVFNNETFRQSKIFSEFAIVISLLINYRSGENRTDSGLSMPISLPHKLMNKLLLIFRLCPLIMSHNRFSSYPIFRQWPRTFSSYFSNLPIFKSLIILIKMSLLIVQCRSKERRRNPNVSFFFNGRGNVNPQADFNTRL